MKKTKVLIIGGNRFVGLRLAYLLDQQDGIELHILNRTGQVAHVKNAVIYKADRKDLSRAHLDHDWDVIVDFAAFDAGDVREALRHFKKIERYIFISTVSVYDLGANLKEDRFDPSAWAFHEEPNDKEKENSYQFGKRQCEALFVQQASFPVLMVRFPIIFGPDDYTRRLAFHVERVREGRPIYFPNVNASIAGVHSEDAANFLKQTLTDIRLTGPINVASPDAIGLAKMMEVIARATGKKPLLMQKESPDIHSPFGAPSDWTVNTERLQSLGYKMRSIKAWLPELIESLAENDSRSRTH